MKNLNNYISEKLVINNKSNFKYDYNDLDNLNDKESLLYSSDDEDDVEEYINITDQLEDYKFFIYTHINSLSEIFNKFEKHIMLAHY